MKIIVKGDTPVWDKEGKCYAGKLELESRTNSPSNDDSGLEDELEVGAAKVETKKVSEPVSVSDEDEDDDDLPF